MATSENNPSLDHSKVSERSEGVQSPYDRLVNRTLQQIDSARSLLEFHLPKELLEHLKLNTLAPADTSFIDLNLRRRFADRLFSVDVSDEMATQCGLKTKYVYLLVLIDHKSMDEPYTVIQMLGYIVRIWESAIENKQPLAPIVPWVIYNGVRPWRGAKSLAELIPVPECWKRYLPALELPILDVSRMDDSVMAGDPILQVTFTLLKYGREADLEVFLRPVLQLLSRSFPGHQAKNLLDTIRTYVMSVNPIVGEEKINEMVSDFWPVQPELGSVADQLIKKGEATGRILGEATGEARGETRGETRGEIRLIQTLQAILRVPQSSNEDFNGKTLEQLRSITEELQQQILKRPS